MHVKHASASWTLLVWVGKAGVRTSAFGHRQAGAFRGCLHQVCPFPDEDLRSKAVRKCLNCRIALAHASVEQLGGRSVVVRENLRIFGEWSWCDEPERTSLRSEDREIRSTGRIAP